MTGPSTGSNGQATVVVAEEDTAAALGSGDVPVLGTPRLVALCEEATVDAIADSLPPDRTSVGVRVELDHLAPSVIGDRVVANAELEVVDGSRLTFAVTASDGRQTVGRGVIVRVVVSRDRFGGRLTR